MEFANKIDYTEGLYLQNGKLWNPIDNGVDSFGLMIRLKISVVQHAESVTVDYPKTGMPVELIGEPGLTISVSGEDDVYRGWATRKLIVQAAANIGKFKE